MSAAPQVVVEKVAERVVLVEVRRGPNNFVDVPAMTELADRLLELDEDPSVSVAVLASEGKHFCAGVDLRGMDGAGIRRFYREGLRLFSGRVPLVAAVHGSAVGGGLGVALAADFRVVAPTSRLTANFARIGFHHGFALSETLPGVVGQQAALDMLYTGRDVSGEEALSIGLADELVDDVRAGAIGVASRLAASAPLSLAAIRSTMRRDLRGRVAVALDHEADAQATLLGTSDFAEGIDAAVNRRTPVFTGS
jgi:enoyl-CoA hydratase/carnithine racemase